MLREIPSNPSQHTILMRSKSLAAFSLLAGLIFTPFSHAASPRALAWDYEIAARKLALVSGGNVFDIPEMHPRKRTTPLHIKGAAPLMLRALDKNPGPDGKPVERACPIPDSIKFPLLVILPDTNHPTGVNIVIVDDDPATFRWGTYRFFNATPKEIAVLMEKSTLRVPVGWKPTDINLGGENRGIGVQMAFSTDLDHVIYSGVWEFDKEVRTLCFLLPGTDPRLGPMAFKMVDESPRSIVPETGASTAAP